MLENLSVHRLARSKSQLITQAMIARKITDKNADMNYKAVPPKAGGDSEREELCRQYPQKFTTTATGASSSSRRLEASGAASSSGRPGAMRDLLNIGEGDDGACTVLIRVSEPPRHNLFSNVI